MHARRFVVIVMGAALLPRKPSMAHEVADPKHGGIVVEGGDLDFELVVDGDGVRVYVEDHGDVVSTAGAQAVLQWVEAGRSREIALVPAPPNKLVGDAGVIAAGSQVTLVVTLGHRGTLRARFPRVGAA